MSNLTNEQLEKLPTHRLLALFKTKQKSISTVGRRFDSGRITKEEFDEKIKGYEENLSNLFKESKEFEKNILEQLTKVKMS